MHAETQELSFDELGEFVMEYKPIRWIDLE